MRKNCFLQVTKTLPLLCVLYALGRMCYHGRMSKKAPGKLIPPFPPVWDDHSRVLILGSFPSVLSRQNAFYYGNPQNRFWRVLGGVYGEPVPDDVPGKRAYLLRHRIALWDALASCEIIGSSDASIKNAVPNNLHQVLDHAPIQRILANGQLAGRMCREYLRDFGGRDFIVLPSTSPANAAWNLERLINPWREALLAE